MLGMDVGGDACDACFTDAAWLPGSQGLGGAGVGGAVDEPVSELPLAVVLALAVTLTARERDRADGAEDERW
jgi:hypothetical protein